MFQPLMRFVHPFLFEQRIQCAFQMCVLQILWTPITKSTEREIASHIQVDEILIVYIAISAALWK